MSEPSRAFTIQSLIFLRDEYESYLRFVPLFRSAVADAYQSSQIDPISFRLLSGLSGVAFIPSACLSLFALRFSELTNFSFRVLQASSVLSIYQPKTNSTKQIDNSFLYNALAGLDISEDTRLLLISYSSLRLQISLAYRRLSFVRPDDIQDFTHIFRHLSTSWLFSKGVDRAILSKRLGHASPDTVERYIRPYSSFSLYSF